MNRPRASQGVGGEGESEVTVGASRWMVVGLVVVGVVLAVFDSWWCWRTTHKEYVYYQAERRDGGGDGRRLSVSLRGGVPFLTKTT